VLEEGVKSQLANYLLRAENKDLFLKRKKEDYLIGGKEAKLYGIQKYLKKVEKRVQDNPPGINIASIARAFYSNHKVPG